MTYNYVGARPNLGSCEKEKPILGQVKIRINARLGVLPSLPRRFVTEASWIMMHTSALVYFSGEGAPPSSTMAQDRRNRSKPAK